MNLPENHVSELAENDAAKAWHAIIVQPMILGLSDGFLLDSPKRWDDSRKIWNLWVWLRIDERLKRQVTKEVPHIAAELRDHDLEYVDLVHDTRPIFMADQGLLIKNVANMPRYEAYRNQGCFSNWLFPDGSVFQGYFNKPMHFANSVFLGTTTFRNFSSAEDTVFDGATFFDVPRFQDTDAGDVADWRSCAFPSTFETPIDAHIAVRRYERLSKMMKQHERHEDEHMFFRYAMRAKRRRDGVTWSTSITFLYGLVCDFGYGIGRAITSFFLVWVAGALGLQFMVFADGKSARWDATKFSTLPHTLGDFFDAGILSFANMLSFLGLSRTFLADMHNRFQRISEGGPGEFSETAISWFNAIGGIQTVLGVVALFFLLLTLRNRFRMH